MRRLLLEELGERKNLLAVRVGELRLTFITPLRCYNYPGASSSGWRRRHCLWAF